MLCFREVLDNDARLLLDWRRSERVNWAMLTDVSHGEEQQTTWIRNSRLRRDYYHWIIQLDTVDIGLVSITAMNLRGIREKEKERPIAVDFGFYLGIDGYGFATLPVLLSLYGYVFSNPDCERIETVVRHENRIIGIHELCGFQREPNLDVRQLKGGEWCDFLGYCLTRQAFEAQPRKGPARNFPVELRAHGTKFMPVQTENENNANSIV